MFERVPDRLDIDGAGLRGELGKKRMQTKLIAGNQPRKIDKACFWIEMMTRVNPRTERIKCRALARANKRE